MRVSPLPSPHHSRDKHGTSSANGPASAPWEHLHWAVCAKGASPPHFVALPQSATACSEAISYCEVQPRIKSVRIIRTCTWRNSTYMAHNKKGRRSWRRPFSIHNFHILGSGSRPWNPICIVVFSVFLARLGFSK